MKEVNQSVPGCDQLNLLLCDRKYYKTDVLGAKQISRLIQFIPSKPLRHFDSLIIFAQTFKTSKIF